MSQKDFLAAARKIVQKNEDWAQEQAAQVRNEQARQKKMQAYTARCEAAQAAVLQRDVQPLLDLVSGIAADAGGGFRIDIHQGKSWSIAEQCDLPVTHIAIRRYRTPGGDPGAGPRTYHYALIREGELVASYENDRPYSVRTSKKKVRTSERKQLTQKAFASELAELVNNCEPVALARLVAQHKPKKKKSGGPKP